MRRAKAGVTLVELLVSAGLMALVLTAVISFYIEAVSVSAKRDEQSTRLRRFHLGLDKIEQLLREGRVVTLRYRTITFLKLLDIPEQDGFPAYDSAPAQLTSTEKGVILTLDGQQTPILPTEAEENVIFTWVQEVPDDPPMETVCNVALYYGGEGKRSGLFFHRTINLQKY